MEVFHKKHQPHIKVGKDAETHLAVSLGWMGWLHRRHQKVQGPTLYLCTCTPSHWLDGCDHQHSHHVVTASIVRFTCHTVNKYSSFHVSHSEQV